MRPIFGLPVYQPAVSGGSRSGMWPGMSMVVDAQGLVSHATVVHSPLNVRPNFGLPVYPRPALANSMLCQVVPKQGIGLACP